MARRWILAAVAACCLAPPAQAQNGASLSDRLNFFKSANPQEEPAYEQPLYEDEVQLAAAVEPANTGSRQMRTAPRTQTQSKGLLSKIRLPNLFGSRNSNDPNPQPPAPYDQSDVRAQRQVQASGAAAGPSTLRANQAARTANQTGQANQGARVANQSAARQTQAAPTTQRTARPAARTVTAPRIARNSPRNDNRHNELAEALSGLRDDAPEVDDEIVTDEPQPRPTSRANATKPAVQKKASPTAATKSAAAKPAQTTPAKPGAMDVSDALLGEDALSQEIAERAADAAQEENGESVGQIPAAAPKAKAAAKSAPAAAKKEAAPKPAAQAPAQSPTTPQNESLGDIPAEPVADTLDDEPPAEAAARPAAQPVAQAPLTTAIPANTVAPAAQAARVESTRGVLLSCRQPVVVSSVEGPPRIIVGRTAAYKVTLENRGDDAARDMTATIAVPAWAEIVDASATNGVVDRVAPAAEGQATSITWQLYELTPGASQTLNLQLVPRGGRPLQLGVQWTHAPVCGEATVEVQEPKLMMDIAGPAEVMYGTAQRYTLTLANPGTGPAEGVTIELTPPGGDQKSLVRHNVGALAPGQTKRIELELTARQAGELKIQAVALATGDLRTESVKTVLCRKAQLQVDWRGPDKNYAGAVATYFFRVRNPGTAAADKVAVAVNLPAGCELIDASDGHQWNSAERALVWQTGPLNASEERFLQLRCRMSQPGINQIDVAARTATGDLSDVKAVPVTIEALADLKLEVSDPKGVVPVGETATYEIHVRNRGLTAAHGVNVIAMFSQGVDPSHVEGGQHAINDGRVSFRTIDSLPAGGEAVFRIHAQATQAGTHLFRAEVVCDDLETKLLAEETTRFFVEEQRWADASTAYSSEAEAATR